MQKNTTMFEIIVQYFDFMKEGNHVLEFILRTINLNTVDTLLSAVLRLFVLFPDKLFALSEYTIIAIQFSECCWIL